MWCNSNTLKFLFRGVRSFVSINRQNFFSPAFTCEQSWNRRLETPLLKKCVLEDLYFELETKYNQSEKINAIDIDVFVNAINDHSHLDEMQDLVHKLRLSCEASNVLDSTHHGFIRSLLRFKRYDDLMSALNDRLNYGIFPDDYCTLLMMDTFLKERDFKNAAIVASFHMLQEDFKNPLINYLSLFSCHQYLLNPTDWDKIVEEDPIPEDDEVIKVRVNYIRNPYFDEHFDLTKSTDLIGKTLILIGKELNDDIGRSYLLLGYILFNKLSEAEILLESAIKNKKEIHKDILDFITKLLHEAQEKNEQSEKSYENLKVLCQNTASNNLVFENSALEMVEAIIIDLVNKTESTLIAQQEDTYEEWVANRNHVLNESLIKIKNEERLAEVRRIKEDLAKKEQELFFFDKEDQLDIEIEKKELQAEEDKLGPNYLLDKAKRNEEQKLPEVMKPGTN